MGARRTSEIFSFIDTCSLLESCWNKVDGVSGAERFEFSQAKADRFWGTEFRSLETAGKVIIPKRNYDELNKHANNLEKLDLSQRAKVILNRIRLLSAEGRVEVVGDPNDPFADAILLSVALKFRTQRNMIFITQDRDLAEDLESIRRFRSVSPRKGYDIKIRRIARNGAVESHRALGGMRGHVGSRKKSTNDRADQVAGLNWWNA